MSSVLRRSGSPMIFFTALKPSSRLIIGPQQAETPGWPAGYIYVADRRKQANDVLRLLPALPPICGWARYKLIIMAFEDPGFRY